MNEKRSTGPNARPKDETIAQTGEGWPDEAGGPPEDVENADEKAAKESLDKLKRRDGDRPEENGDPSKT